MGSVATCKQQYCCGNRLNCTGPEDPPSNNGPFAVIELTQEQYEFAMRNCETNLTLGLELMQQAQSRAVVENLVQMNNDFKSLRDALKKGKQ